MGRLAPLARLQAVLRLLPLSGAHWPAELTVYEHIRPEAGLHLLTNLAVPVLILLLDNEYMLLETWQHN